MAVLLKACRVVIPVQLVSYHRAEHAHGAIEGSRLVSFDTGDHGLALKPMRSGKIWTSSCRGRLGGGMPLGERYFYLYDPDGQGCRLQKSL